MSDGLLDEGEMDADVIYGVASNSLSVAGMVKMNPRLVNLSDGKFELLRGSDPGKDQSYFLHRLNQEQLRSMIAALLARHRLIS